MSITRRGFIKGAAVVGGALGLGIGPNSFAYSDIPKAEKPLRILILGGTGFIGPYQVNYALARGHKITLFNRGKTRPNLFPGVEHMVGDRNGDLGDLKNIQGK